ncbi:hypothetical protein K0M31_011836, partial [Melipona bicolor]
FTGRPKISDFGASKEFRLGTRINGGILNYVSYFCLLMSATRCTGTVQKEAMWEEISQSVNLSGPRWISGKSQQIWIDLNKSVDSSSSISISARSFHNGDVTNV